VPNPVTLRDLPATILTVAAIECNGRIPGTSLSRWWDMAPGINNEEPSSLLSEVNYSAYLPAFYPVSGGDLKSLATPHFHYIRNADGSEMLFDWEDDYFERRNVATTAEGAACIEYFRRTLETILKRKLTPD